MNDDGKNRIDGYEHQPTKSSAQQAVEPEALAQTELETGTKANAMISGLPATGREVLLRTRDATHDAIVALSQYELFLNRWLHDEETSASAYHDVIHMPQWAGLLPWLVEHGMSSLVHRAADDGWPTHCRECGGQLGPGSRGEWNGTTRADWLCSACAPRNGRKLWWGKFITIRAEDDPSIAELRAAQK